LIAKSEALNQRPFGLEDKVVQAALGPELRIDLVNSDACASLIRSTKQIEQSAKTGRRCNRREFVKRQSAVIKNSFPPGPDLPRWWAPLRNSLFPPGADLPEGDRSLMAGGTVQVGPKILDDSRVRSGDLQDCRTKAKYIRRPIQN
jgi:hypothetical protein